MLRVDSFDRHLAEDIGSFARNPLGFVRYAFRWGTGELQGFSGPDTWQREVLEEIGAALSSGAGKDDAPGTAMLIVREAVASGHGVGKSALVAWIVLWAMCTCVDAKGVVTANTEAQLRTKTWAELAKWHRLCLCGHWFECTATALISRAPGHEKTWRCDMVAWSERNTEAFAGLHNKGRRVLLVFDEASAVPDVLWEVAEGAQTDEDTEIIWCAFGNPTRNTGRFRECFGRFRHRWHCRQVDSRTAAMTNKEQLSQWVQDYGEDSDFVRVRVRGEFPRAGDVQFIPSDVVHAARGRQVSKDHYEFAPKILGVDVARFGSDQSVICRRQGLMVFDQHKLRGVDTVTLSGIIAGICREWQADRVFVDGVGVGAGVVDCLNRVHDIPATDAVSSAAPFNKARFLNRRAEMWSEMRDWLAKGGALPDDPELAEHLTGLEYQINASGKLQLESKDSLKKRGLASPDCADALALTFYAPVEAGPVRSSRALTEYDVTSWGGAAEADRAGYNPLGWGA